jgi:hypothetical protein
VSQSELFEPDDAELGFDSGLDSDLDEDESGEAPSLDEEDSLFEPPSSLAAAPRFRLP